VAGVRIVLLVAALALSACSGPFDADEGTAREELLRIAPLGSDARTAVATLKDMGFKCVWNEHRPFKGMDGNHDYLYCDYSKMVDVLITRRWQIALVHDNFRVVDARFGIGLTGL
jgi:hypothetical protein